MNESVSGPSMGGVDSWALSVELRRGMKGACARGISKHTSSDIRRKLSVDLKEDIQAWIRKKNRTDGSTKRIWINFNQSVLNQRKSSNYFIGTFGLPG